MLLPRRSLLPLFASAALPRLLGAQAAQTPEAPPSVVAGGSLHYDESAAAGYTLPDPLSLPGGKHVTDARTWNRIRRPEIVRLFEANQFGRSPARPEHLRFEAFENGENALNGKALRKQVTIEFTEEEG